MNYKISLFIYPRIFLRKMYKIPQFDSICVLRPYFHFVQFKLNRNPRKRLD